MEARGFPPYVRRIWAGSCCAVTRQSREAVGGPDLAALARADRGARTSGGFYPEGGEYDTATVRGLSDARSPPTNRASGLSGVEPADVGTTAP